MIFVLSFFKTTLLRAPLTFLFNFQRENKRTLLTKNEKDLSTRITLEETFTKYLFRTLHKEKIVPVPC